MLKLVTQGEANWKLEKGDILIAQRFRKKLLVYLGVWMGEDRVMIQGLFKPKVVRLYRYRKHKVYHGLRKIKISKFM